MRPSDVVLILASVVLSATSQVVLKRGMTAPAIRAAIDGGGALDTAVAVSTSPAVIGGLACFGLSAVIWLFVLSRVALSTAYPFVALGIVLTIAAGATLFGEPVSGRALIGAALIVVGVVLVGSAA